MRFNSLTVVAALCAGLLVPSIPYATEAQPTVVERAPGEKLAPQPDTPKDRLATYRKELATFRGEFGGTVDLPNVDFFLFGMGARTKLIYRDGVLKDAVSDEVVQSWQIDDDLILPPEYAVHIKTLDGATARIVEDESGVWIEAGGQRNPVPGTQSAVNLPNFSEYTYARIIRVLHQEILINVINGQPVPNFIVYPKPWYRDSAMMAMVLEHTDNLDLIKNWILGIREPYDRNNDNETEADNLGQALYLISLVSDASHPLVKTILDELPKFEVESESGKYIKGRSDFADHPVYQTKWAKLGLTALDLEDPYVIPEIFDSYSSLFWMGYKERHVSGRDSRDKVNYPYLDWGSDHFHGVKNSPISDRDYPLTWERDASEASYEELRRLDPLYVDQLLSAPHTWHGAEVFLYLVDYHLTTELK
jgi:hypothetical protein